MKGAWCWNEEVEEKVEGKKQAYVAFIDSGMDKQKEARRARYKFAKWVAKKAVILARNMTYDRLYQKLEIKGDEKEVFKLAKARKRRIRGLGDVRCFKDEDGKDLDEEAQVKEI